MPLYTARCSNSHKATFYSKIADRDNARQCDLCGANLTRVIEAPMVRGDIQPYTSPIDGRWVNSGAQRREDLKRNGCIEWEPGQRQDAPRHRAEAQEKAFAPIAQSIEQTARDLISAGKLDPL